ncbi:Di-copper centre-containing protein [Corynespora cassiicola Philippines]|uniref:Di-copper centre-containing protein n=1 Tax=Corynespora cassiicola Philippines TaxID=1448308 RepID=A0A2T2NZ43_CORCC|nr:Di-copper centre-containing protein [Corynespora cassiicola Philippines]
MIYSPLLQLFAFGSLAVQAFAACKEPTVRKDWRSLTEDERDRFISAQQKLWNKDADPATNQSVYDRDFVLLHRRSTPSSHNVPGFLPWHRKFLRDYEIALQAIDPTVSLPYWNWADDNASLNTSLIWDKKYFGGDGQGSDYCVQDGRYANWTLRLGGHLTDPEIDIEHCLRRMWSRGISSTRVTGPVVPSMSEIRTAIKGYNGSYEDFLPWWEGHHGTIHLGIGGFSTDLNGDMTPVTNSPNEPVFWLHHTFVDRIWAEFQESTPFAHNSYGGLPSANSQLPSDDPIWNNGGKLSDVMKPWDVTVESAFSTKGDYYCYTYE